MLLILGAFAIGTASVSATTLRLSSRARDAVGPFAYSFSYGFGLPDAAQEGLRRTVPHAVALIEPGPQQWLAIRARRSDTVAGPIDVRIWCDGEIVLKGRLDNGSVIEGLAPMKAPNKVLLEMRAHPSRIAPLWSFATDSGVLVSWEMIDQGPLQFRRYDSHRGDQTR
jgi:hypothetical protein